MFHSLTHAHFVDKGCNFLWGQEWHSGDLGCSRHPGRPRGGGPGLRRGWSVLEPPGPLTPEVQSCHSLICFLSLIGLEAPKAAFHPSRSILAMLTAYGLVLF